MALKVPWLRRRVDRKPIGCCQRLIAACLATSECVARPDVKKIVCFIRKRPLVPTRIFGRLPRLHGHAERLVLAECRAKKSPRLAGGGIHAGWRGGGDDQSLCRFRGQRNPGERLEMARH